MEKLYAIATIVVSLLLVSAGAKASCWVKYTSEEVQFHRAVLNSDLIFVGEVKSVIKTIYQERRDSERIIDISADFKILQMIKGADSNSINVSGDNVDRCGCNYNFQPEIEYLVFARLIDERYRTHHCNLITTEYSDDIPSIEELIGSVDS
ncbi:hypothetical protein [Parahaliea mediterranea]|uniref:Uncharacterized protein n=1 Tax=Parahaliea mediterranea TaxID=651086 RepID=A0A939DG86_9GAMM|nr:hypothetical protein [Parahaliea mediterranea]MBN7797644.1 hypothetical protein [Parahaliea mediterranea]